MPSIKDAFQLFAPKLPATEQSPVFDCEACHNLMVHGGYFLFSLPLTYPGFCTVWSLAVRLTGKIRSVQCDDYICVLLLQPDQSETDVGMSWGESLWCYVRSRGFGDCCESKNGCVRSVKGQAVSGMVCAG